MVVSPCISICKTDPVTGYCYGCGRTNNEKIIWKKEETSDMWKEKFLRQTIKNAYKGLKKGKFLALNVANTKQYKTFEEDTVKLAIESGFKHTDTWWLSLSTQQGKQEQGSLDGTTEVKQKQQYMGEFTRPDIAGRKFEPTFIFQK